MATPSQQGVCPVCAEKVPLTPVKRQLKRHLDESGKPCPGFGAQPQMDADATAREEQARRRTWRRYWRHLSRTAKILNTVLFTIVAGALGILAYFGIGPNPHLDTGPQLVSASGGNEPANADSGRPSIDRKGQYIAFTSAATNLSPSATSGQYNIYRKNLKGGAIDLISASTTGTAANGSSQFPVICPTGRYVAFASTSTDLVTEMLGKKPASIYQVYVRDAVSRQTTLISVNRGGRPGNGDSRSPSFSADCSRIGFESVAGDLVTGDGDKNYDIFVRDLRSSTTTLASVDGSGQKLNGESTHPNINGAGTEVAFTSWASNVQDVVTGQPSVFVRDFNSGQTVSASASFAHLGTDVRGYSWPNFSGDGRYLIFRSITDSNDPSKRGSHVVVWDVQTRRSAVTGEDGRTATGWNDACVTGVNNGTSFSPIIANTSKKASYLVLFPVARDGVCNLVLRDLAGNDVQVAPDVNVQQVLEPTLNSFGSILSWDVAGQPQLIYYCAVKDCTKS
jgi:Tol biopolymer transport system component